MTPDELSQIVQAQKEAQQQIRTGINVCVAAGCISSHSDQVKEAIAREVDARGLKKTCQVKGVGCLGLCTAGPLVMTQPAGTLYQGVTEADAADIVDSVAHPENAPVKRLE